MEVHGHVPGHFDQNMHELSVSKAWHDVVILELALGLCEAEDVVSDPLGEVIVCILSKQILIRIKDF